MELRVESGCTYQTVACANINSDKYAVMKIGDLRYAFITPSLLNSVAYQATRIVLITLYDQNTSMSTRTKGQRVRICPILLHRSKDKDPASNKIVDYNDVDMGNRKTAVLQSAAFLKKWQLSKDNGFPGMANLFRFVNYRV